MFFPDLLVDECENCRSNRFECELFRRKTVIRSEKTEPRRTLDRANNAGGITAEPSLRRFSVFIIQNYNNNMSSEIQCKWTTTMFFSYIYLVIVYRISCNNFIIISKCKIVLIRYVEWEVKSLSRISFQPWFIWVDKNHPVKLYCIIEQIFWK